MRFDAGGALLAEVRQYYDGPPANGLPLGQVERGLLSRQEEAALPLAEADAIYGAGAVDWPALGYHQIVRFDGVASWAVNRSRLTHSATGMMTSRVDALGGTSTYEYDADGLLLAAVTNELGHVARATYDPAWQLIEERTDINGARTRYSYDPRGRVETVVRPGDSDAFPTLRYERRDDVLPLSVRTEKRRRTNAADAYEKVTYFDGFGREIQTRSRVDGDQVRVTGAVGYNRKGDVVAKGTPLLRQGLDFEAPDVLPPTPVFTYRHDSLGRVIAAVNLEGREMRVALHPVVGDDGRRDRHRSGASTPGHAGDQALRCLRPDRRRHADERAGRHPPRQLPVRSARPAGGDDGPGGTAGDRLRELRQPRRTIALRARLGRRADDGVRRGSAAWSATRTTARWSSSGSTTRSAASCRRRSVASCRSGFTGT